MKPIISLRPFIDELEAVILFEKLAQPKSNLDYDIILDDENLIVKLVMIKKSGIQVSISVRFTIEELQNHVMLNEFLAYKLRLMMDKLIPVTYDTH